MNKQFAILLLWFLAVSIPMTYLMGFHTFAFKSKPLDKITQAPEITRDSKWQMIHILSSKCACSKRVGVYLVERKPLANINEVVLILDDKEMRSEKKLKDAGFKVVRIDGNLAFEKYDINAAPQLVILDQDLQVKYSGGYNDARESLYDDQKIMASLQRHLKVESHPIFGCANGKRTADLVDPWGLKY